MPHRRPNKRGSFGGRFDDLVKQFPDRETDSERAAEEKKRGFDTEKRHINDRLFESAWRKARETERGRRQPDMTKAGQAAARPADAIAKSAASADRPCGRLRKPAAGRS
jgi:hypothetical protein